MITFPLSLHSIHRLLHSFKCRHTAFSSDGITDWSVERFSNVFNASIPLLSGGVVELDRRERSQVLFDSLGRPAFLFNGATSAAPNGDHSFTTVQPVLLP
jgi:hypothetical protein